MNALLGDFGMLDNVAGKDLPQPSNEQANAMNSLHEDALSAMRNASVQKPESKVEVQSVQTAGKEESANDRRIKSESKFFTYLYTKANVDLDPAQMKNGALQCLQQMQKDGKISMSQERMQAEAKRIEERDEKDPSIRSGGHEKLWSEKEIKQMVDAMVARPKGIDVSNWQSKIDWKQVKDAGYQFVFMKATEGNDFIDHTFDEYRKGARDAGLKVGYYHFYQPSVPVDEQINLFCSVVGKAEPDALRLVIDAEDDSIWQKYPQEERARMVDEFLTGVQKKLGVTPQVAIYCSNEFANGMLGNAPELKKFSPWIAYWGTHDPPVPQPWDNWDFWQYTDIGDVAGIPDKVDLDVFNGTSMDQAIRKSPVIHPGSAGGSPASKK